MHVLLSPAELSTPSGGLMAAVQCILNQHSTPARRHVLHATSRGNNSFAQLTAGGQVRRLHMQSRTDLQAMPPGCKPMHA